MCANLQATCNQTIPQLRKKRKAIVLDGPQTESIDDLDGIDEMGVSQEKAIRAFDRDVRLHSCLYHSNRFAASVVR